MKVGDLIQCKSVSVWERDFCYPAKEGAFLIVDIVLENEDVTTQRSWWLPPPKKEDRLYFYTLIQPDGTMAKWNSRHTNCYYEVIS